MIWGQFRKASRATATLPSPLREHVKLYEARGEDLTVAVRNEFWTTQKDLFPYRVAKLKAEVAYLRSGFGGFSLATWSIKDVVCTFRFWVRILSVFIAGVMLGRQSYFPMLEPGSPFVLGLKYQNPNYVLPQYSHVVDCGEVQYHK
jgi:hypothetical protein